MLVDETVIVSASAPPGVVLAEVVAVGNLVAATPIVLRAAAGCTAVSRRATPNIVASAASVGNVGDPPEIASDSEVRRLPTAVASDTVAIGGETTRVAGAAGSTTGDGALTDFAGNTATALTGAGVGTAGRPAAAEDWATGVTTAVSECDHRGAAGRGVEVDAAGWGGGGSSGNDGGSSGNDCFATPAAAFAFPAGGAALARSELPAD